MKNVTVNVQIQFDIPSNGNVVDSTVNTLDEINKVLQERFPDISPVIFTSSIDDSDIVEDNENEE